MADASANHDLSGGASDLSSSDSSSDAGAPFDASPPALPGEFGVLTNFYRATQLQGSLAINGLEIMAPPSYLVDLDVDIKYKPKMGMSPEVLFVDNFIITRFLGGETEDAVAKLLAAGVAQSSIPYDSAAPARSLDYARSNGSGGWMYYGTGQSAQNDLISARLTPYLNAGYTPADMTLVLSNVPWDAARTGGYSMNTANCGAPPTGISTGAQGTWGQCNPPLHFTDWGTIVGQFASDLVTRFGAAQAARFSFEVGDEYDTQQSYNATSVPTSQDFYSLYDSAYTAVKSKINGAAVLAGDFTGLGSGATLNYSTADFLTHEASLDQSVSYVPRSLNADWSSGTLNKYQPSALVASAVNSYGMLPNGVIPEVHQFGFLNMPNPIGGKSTDQSAISANWYFQALLSTKEQLNPRRVTHWVATQNIQQTKPAAPLTLLNGTGYVDLILDHYQGAEMYDLAVVLGSGSATSEVKAFAFWKDGKTALGLSHFDVGATAAARTITVTVPSALVPSSTTSFRYLRSSPTPVDDVYVAIKSDLAGASLLTQDFQSCALCFGTPSDLVGATTTAELAPALPTLTTNATKYMAIAKQGITWRSTANVAAFDANGVTHALTFSGTDQTLQITLGPNELLVLEPQ